LPEGLSASEVGKEIAEHQKQLAEEGDSDSKSAGHHEKWLSVAEALILSLVAVLSTYSGFAAAKWGTDSSLKLAKASALRSKSNQADTRAIVTRTLDAVYFDSWFSAYLSGNKRAELVAERRLRPGYRPAFYAWLATDPFHNPKAPPGPSYMPQYVIPEATIAAREDAAATRAFAEGTAAGGTSDDYVRDTVFLATVLFLVGISGHFSLRNARLGLIIVGIGLLVFAVTQLAGLPTPP
jgi:hypothetical protein